MDGGRSPKSSPHWLWCSHLFMADLKSSKILPPYRLILASAWSNTAAINLKSWLQTLISRPWLQKPKRTPLR